MIGGQIHQSRIADSDAITIHQRNILHNLLIVDEHSVSTSLISGDMLSQARIKSNLQVLARNQRIQNLKRAGIVTPHGNNCLRQWEMRNFSALRDDHQRCQAFYLRKSQPRAPYAVPFSGPLSSPALRLGSHHLNSLRNNCRNSE